MNSSVLDVPGFRIQEKPPIYVAAISGRWLLERCTPVWRIEDPELGFQRIVREGRARAIALAVLDQQRTFPNAIVLATDRSEIEMVDGRLRVPADVRLLVVDGQHRLWAQKFSKFTAEYACVIHPGLSEVEMARLFLEINDTQRRVPSSLRWDLVRLVRPEDDPAAIAAAEMIQQLESERESPLYQRIDLTGEQPELSLKQGSLAPELRRLVASRGPLYRYSYEQQYTVILQFFVALRELDAERWGRRQSSFFKARVLRALLRLLGDIVKDRPLEDLTAHSFLPLLRKIDAVSLATEAIRGVQASAGVKAIYDQIRTQVLSQ